MAQWNGGEYYGGPHPHPGAPPYVGFQDFLQQLQAPAPGPSPAPSPSLQYPTRSNYNKENTRVASQAIYFPESNIQYGDKSGAYNDRAPDENLASHSKLTATAVEFVPLSARNPFPVNADSNSGGPPWHALRDPTPCENRAPETQPPGTNPLEPRAHGTREVSRGPDNKKSQGAPRNPKWKTRSNAINSTNWRSRDPEDPETAETASLTVYNSNRPLDQSGSVRSGAPRPAREPNGAVGSATKAHAKGGRKFEGDQRRPRGPEDNGGKGRGEDLMRQNNNVIKKTSFKDKRVENREVGQRERLSEQLDRGELECLVCCERVRQADAVWACSNCYHVLHLKCVQKWANTSIAEGEWRCPACQNKVRGVPTEYRCFCGAQRQPEWVRGAAAHSCGEPCGARRACSLHACALPCHPGPCPPCEASARRACQCGATRQLLKCSFRAPLLCGDVCARALSCGAHACAALCHAGPCEPCPQRVAQRCYCPHALQRDVACEAASAGVEGFSCGEECSRIRSCGQHPCGRTCHPGPCPDCDLSPETVKRCPCNQTELTVVRSSCLDPIPECGEECSRPFPCGPPESPHVCRATCHHGDCPPCLDKTAVSCRCGHIQQDVACEQLAVERNKIRCGRKCTKKQSCGRHRCKERCCVDIEHRCPLPCTRTLSCGLHRCEDTCHRAHCQPCWRVSFEEMRCRCGAAVRYPPVECGARAPPCTLPCPEPRACGHEALHSCHPAPSPCPPCVVLTQRYCHGRHKMRKTIPCHQEDFSCGLACGKELSCGRHRCVEVCHRGACPSVCTQLCAGARPCGHACAAPCGHASPCPARSLCRASAPAACPCGRRQAARACHEQRAARLRLTTLPGPLGEPVDMAALMAQGNTNVTLECDLECQVEDRNRRLAIGLQIRNPDLSSKLAPKYSDSLKQMATREEAFAQRTHEQLTQLVTLARDSKQRTRSHSFPPMSRQRRQFIHELCEHFGCDSAAYDAEPYRNIVATAYKDRSWLPALSVQEVVRRERGQRRVPRPQVLPSARSGSAWATLGPAPLALPPAAPPARPRIDYFDAPPED